VRKYRAQFFSKIPGTRSSKGVIRVDLGTIQISRGLAQGKINYTVPQCFLFHNQQLQGRSRSVTELDDLPSLYSLPYTTYFQKTNIQKTLAYLTLKYQIIKQSNWFYVQLGSAPQGARPRDVRLSWTWPRRSRTRSFPGTTTF
jgi:hypothetical protein